MTPDFKGLAGRGFLTMLVTALVAGAAFYLLREHWAHAAGLAPYLLFLACPLMHLFMHHGRKHDRDAHNHTPPRDDASP